MAEPPRQLRIAVVLWSADIGGAETLMLRLAHRFTSLGHRAALVLVSRPGPLVTLIDERGIPWECLERDPGSRVLFAPRHFARAVTRAGADACILPALGFLAPALRWGGYSGKILAVEHGDILQAGRWDFSTRVRRAIDRKISATCVDSDVAVSEFVAQVARQSVVRSAVTVIPNGVDTAEFSPEPRVARETPVIGFAGRFVAGKGADVLASALCALPVESDWRCNFAGDGPERPAIEAKVAGSPIASRVSFIGWARSMPDFWRSCDVAIVPSHQSIESFGMVAVEAMACGIPVVASRQGGLEEVVLPGVTGTFALPGDPVGLADAINLYLKDPGLRAEHGRRARQHVESRFDLARIADRWIDHIAGLVSTA